MSEPRGEAIAYPERYFDEFKVGDAFVTREATLTREECLDFARRYDPQAFHIDEEAAATSMFRGLAASGWQTAALVMRLIVDSGVLRGPGVLGAGVDELRWLAPVYPGDTLHVEGNVIELTPDPEGKRRGRMRVRLHAFNQDGVRVFSHVAILSVMMRPQR